jgi:pimeloyl-ACP methyl ester carboxylesterase
MWLNLAVWCVALGACSQRGSTTNDAGPRGFREDTPDARVSDPELVRFSTADGWTIVGDLRVRRRGGRAVLFVHQLSSNRGEWARFALRIAGPIEQAERAHGGVSTLAIDLRGHGESTSSNDGTLRWTAFGNDRARWMSLEYDVAAAVHVLRQRVATTQIVIVGSGIGGSAATLYAARSGAPVVGLVLLSPSSEARGVPLVPPLMQVLRARKRVLMLAASGDTSASDTLRDVQQQASRFRDDGGPALLEIERYDDASAHGVSLGAEGVHPEMWTRIERFVNSL